MTDDAATLLATLPAWAFGFVLVMARIGSAITLLPGLGESQSPPMVRVGLALGVTVLLLPAIEPSVPPVPEVSAQAAFMIVAEVITGLWIGWLARLLVLALAVAGQFIANMWASRTFCSRIPTLAASHPRSSNCSRWSRRSLS
jgi:flagellar biosynthesis protein FliR